MANHVDIVLERKKRARRRRMIKVFIVLLFLGLGIFIYRLRDVWFPKLEGIGSRYQDNVTRSEDADLTGEFELKVSGGVDYHAGFIGNSLLILCDKYLYVYTSDGKQKDSRQHAYSNAIMKIAGSRALIYSHNGTSFRLDTPNGNVYQAQTEKPIWFGVLSEDGYAAIVTESETYACRLNIFDQSGKLMYSRECVERLSDVSFCSNGCIFSTVGATDGELLTTLSYITFDSDEVVWETEPLPTLCYELYAIPEGGAFVIGDDLAAYYSSTGALVGSYDYNATLVDYDYADGKAAILLQNEQRRQSTLLLFSDKSTAPETVSIDSREKSVILYDGEAYVLGAGSIRSFGFNGSETGSQPVKDAYDRILRYGKYFYLLGYDKINRVTIK
ncbi:MAG: hypothetical protein II916_02395 [Oscillospiraceae bacterium]|nr:hypothetical protein [Oscillospiraceae bacterium]